MFRILIAALTLIPTLVFAAPEKSNIDAKESLVKWTGNKIGNVAGKHQGTVAVSGGTITSDDGKITGGEINIDMTTIKDEDQKDPAMNAKLVGHLNSPDFFDTTKYKTAKFVITKVMSMTPIGSDGASTEYVFAGDLTIHGKTNITSIKANVSRQDKKWIAFGETEIDRTKFDVKYNSPKLFPDLLKTAKDKVISDSVLLAFTIKTDGK